MTVRLPSITIAAVPDSNPKWYKHPTQLPKISHDMVIRVADQVAKGVPLKLALALENPPQTVEHWNKTLLHKPTWSRLVEQRLALFVSAAMDQINSALCKTLPGMCWTLERRLPEYYSTSHQALRATVNVNTTLVVGLPGEVLTRTRLLVRQQDKLAQAKRLKERTTVDAGVLPREPRPIDVSATVTAIAQEQQSPPSHSVPVPACPTTPQNM